jgi:RimJ/RimL family protein N-acetyltransferase
VLLNRDPVLWIAVENGRPVGSLRFDRRDDATAEISVSIAAERRGKGAGAQAIREATELFLAAHPEVRATVAEVRSENAGSIRAFERGGYRLRPGAAGPMHVLEAALPGLRSSPR